MTISSLELLARLGGHPELLQSFKAITEVSALGDSIIQPQKFATFIEEMQHSTVMLPAARFLEMTSNQRDIDRISFTGRLIHSGKNASEAHRSLDASEFVSFQTATNKLITNELIAITSLRDDTLRENIAKGTLEGTVLRLFGQGVGRDFEEFAIFGDKTGLTYADDDVLSKSDGWARKAANKVYGRDVSGQIARDFDGAAAYTDPEDMFEIMLESAPKQYFSDPGSWRLYVPWSIENAYRDVLRARGTALGDQSQTGNAGLFWKGLKIEQVPLFSRGANSLGSDAIKKRNRIEGQLAFLGVPSNFVWGVFHQVTVEPEREAKERRTDFVLTCEPDMHFEDENAVVVAFIDKANPTAA